MRSRLATLAVTAGLVLGACGGGSDAAQSAGTPGDGLLDFEAPSVGAETVDVREYAGSDLVIWFWAPW